MTAQPDESALGTTLAAHPPRMDKVRIAADQPATHSTIAWAEGVLSETASDRDVRIIDLRVLRDGTKRLAVVTLTDGTSLVLKQYANDRGAWTHLWMDRLCEAGFAPPARHSVTPARGWSHTHSTLVADMAPEHPWTAWLVESAASRTAAAGAAADWLVALQALDISLPDRIQYRAADELALHCEELGAVFPDFKSTLHEIQHDIHAQLYETSGSKGATLVPSHGDLHPNNLHIADDAHLSVMAIDVDTAGMRRPSYDVGYAIAQMLIVSWMRTGSLHAGAAAAEVFWRRWAKSGAPDASAVGAESARALFQSLHFELVTYHNGRTELLLPWLAVARSMLTDGVPHTLCTLATPEEIAS